MVICPNINNRSITLFLFHEIGGKEENDTKVLIAELLWGAFFYCLTPNNFITSRHISKPSLDEMMM